MHLAALFLLLVNSAHACLPSGGGSCGCSVCPCSTANIPPAPLYPSAPSYTGQYDVPNVAVAPNYQGKAPLQFASSPEELNSPYSEHVSLTHAPLKDEHLQIQVSPSAVATSEDSYTSSSNGFLTYYNQKCSGETITVSEKETLTSATRKCVLLDCAAANALKDSSGTYTVEFLKEANARVNSKKSYCLTTRELPLKSKRVLRKLEDMLSLHRRF